MPDPSLSSRSHLAAEGDRDAGPPTATSRGADAARSLAAPIAGTARSTAGPGPEARDAVFEDAYREHASAVLGLARRVLSDRSLAEEVTQEVFLRLWRQPDRFDPTRGCLRSFLLAECRGRSIDAVRSEAARRRREERDGWSGGLETHTDVAVDVCDADVHHHVEDRLEALPGAEREAISLAYFGELTYREVAAVLDTPEGTVKGRIRTGLHRMRSHLRESGIDPA